MSKKRIMYRWLKIFVLILIAFEVYNIVSDIYNFKQFWKAKEILDTMPEDSRKFYHLDEFNSQYNADIQPIRNCYYVNNDNGDEKYIFAFKNYSIIYKIIYGEVFTYPKYDRDVWTVCIWGKGCYDKRIEDFYWITSHKCDDYGSRKIFN